MKRATCAILLMIICSSCCFVSACTIGNVNIVFGEEAKEELVFSFGEHGGCTREEMIVYFILARSEYEEVFGREVWGMKIDDMSMEEFVKNNILARALEEKCMSALAKLKGLSLDEAETNGIEADAQKVYNTFFKGKAGEISIAPEDVVSVLTDARLAELAFEHITRDVDTEISDAEAKVITVQYIKCDLNGKYYAEALELMEEIHELLAESRFDTVAARYADKTVSGTVDICKNEKLEITRDGGVLENKLFELTDGELSEVIAVGDEAIYIFKSVEDYDPDKTEDNKAVILKKRKNDIMQKEYDAFIDSIDYTFDEAVWENLHFDEWL